MSYKIENSSIALLGSFGIYNGQSIESYKTRVYCCLPFNYQKIYTARNYAVEKIGRREHISAPVFYYDLNLN